MIISKYLIFSRQYELIVGPEGQVRVILPEGFSPKVILLLLVLKAQLQFILLRQKSNICYIICFLGKGLLRHRSKEPSQVGSVHVLATITRC